MRSLHPAAADHRVSIRGSRCTALILPFASEPSGGASLLLSTSVLQRERECGRYGNSSGGHGLAGYQVRADKHTRSVRWPAPLRAQH